MSHARRLACALLVLIIGGSLWGGCYGPSPSAGGGQTKVADTGTAARHINPADIALPPGFRIEAVARDLTYPSGVCFDEQNRPCVVEAGYSYGESFTTPRLLRVGGDGAVTQVAAGDNSGPWNGVAFHDGAFYVSQGGVMTGGRIARITTDGKIAHLVSNLPSVGDHHVNGPVVTRDGQLYFSIGVATNSGVVGTDSYKFGWLQRHPEFCDVPPRDIKLTGENFTSDNPLTPGKPDKAVTGAYMPFGQRSEAGQVIRGKTPGTGTIYRMAIGAGARQATTRQAPNQGAPAKLELVAWGLRNPFGLALAPDIQLYVTENQFDDRGSRPVWGTGDLLWKIALGTWYGWPDFHGDHPLAHDHFQPPGKAQPKFLLAEHPNKPPKPAAILGVHSSACGLDFSRSEQFGFPGEAFVAVFGDMSPSVGKVMGPVGFRVLRVNVNDGTIETFATNRGKKNGPASYLKSGGLERPVACKFDNSGKALYVVDFGVMTMGSKPQPKAGTGVLWRITRSSGGEAVSRREP